MIRNLISSVILSRMAQCMANYDIMSAKRIRVTLPLILSNQINSKIKYIDINNSSQLRVVLAFSSDISFYYFQHGWWVCGFVLGVSWCAALAPICVKLWRAYGRRIRAHEAMTLANLGSGLVQVLLRTVPFKCFVTSMVL